MKAMNPVFTHEELMVLADAISQYHENQDAEELERAGGPSQALVGALEKLEAYQANEPHLLEDPWPHPHHPVTVQPAEPPPGLRLTGVFQIETCQCGMKRHVWITTYKVDAGAWQ